VKAKRAFFQTGKRALLEQEMKKNTLKPNGFHFLLSGKRSGLPRPNNFLFPVKKDIQVLPRRQILTRHKNT
jgi:hypothetical protein